MVMFAPKDLKIDVRDGLLGTRARWGRVGYSGEAFAPALETYRWLDSGRVTLTSVADSGRLGSGRRGLANLHPLAAAALYEIAFVQEFGPLATWRN